ncbi:MAG: hypothetical protein ABIJ97_16090 [Bacteroidota bacterium]
MKKIHLYFLSLIFLGFILNSCDEPEDNTIIETPKIPSMLVIVEDGIYNDIKSQLSTYVNDFASGDTTPLVIQWGTGTVESLRDTIKSYYDRYQINNVFMVGDLPVAWYELEAYENFDSYEEFPCDIFLMSPHTLFDDANSNGKYDYHASLDLKVGVGRIIGSVNEIKGYIDRAHDYRANGSLVAQQAYLFIDNDWSDWINSSPVNVSYLYSQSEMLKDTMLTNRSAYITKLTGSGAEYVHQMIHSYPSSMAIYHLGAKEYITTNDIKNNNFKASFFNMFNCSGARYTEENLGMTNVMGTNFGLAIMGTTKTGGNYSPTDFHYALSNGYSWGEAFVYWTKNGGYYFEDKWRMGLCLLGDPMLKISPATTKSINKMQIPESTQDYVSKLEEIIVKMERQTPLSNYEQFKMEHPQYYQ